MNVMEYDIIMFVLILGILFSLLLLINIKGWNLFSLQLPKKILGLVTVESMENNIDVQKELENMKMNKTDSFCENHRKSGKELNEACQRLTNDNCNSTSCCVWLNETKCVAGDHNGPTFKTENGVKIDVDTYYYKNKCYGNKC
jgi:hypothetical protein